MRADTGSGRCNVDSGELEDCVGYFFDGMRSVQETDVG